uniref:Uncharacterized protein n=1 Tax=Oryza glumipatula TaxID=40148 RepID=A0A0D9ZM64_9ORYZ
MGPTYHPPSLPLPLLFHPPIFLSHSLPFGQPPPHGLEHRGKSMWDKKPPATAHGGVHAPVEHEEEEGLRDEAEEAVAAQEEEGGGGGTTEVTTKEEDFETSVHMRRGKAVARRWSMVSLGMATAVGAVVWAADALCLPLLAGMFATVGMSMCSVARFFLRESAAALQGDSTYF